MSLINVGDHEILWGKDSISLDERHLMACCSIQGEKRGIWQFPIRSFQVSVFSQGVGGGWVGRIGNTTNLRHRWSWSLAIYSNCRSSTQVSHYARFNLQPPPCFIFYMQVCILGTMVCFKMDKSISLSLWPGGFPWAKIHVVKVGRKCPFNLFLINFLFFFIFKKLCP